MRSRRSSCRASCVLDMRPSSQAGRRLRFLLSANCVVLTVKYEPLRQTCSISAHLPKSSNCLFSHFGLRRRRRRRGTDVVLAPAELLPSPLRSACPRGFGRRTQGGKGFLSSASWQAPCAPPRRTTPPPSSLSILLYQRRIIQRVRLPPPAAVRVRRTSGSLLGGLQR